MDGIAAERELLRDVREEADLVIDTSALNVHELRARMRDSSAPTPGHPRVNVVSFGYKYGLPVDADMVADCRFLPNPRWVPELAPLTGQDEPVRDYVLSRPGAAEFLDSYLAALRMVLDGYEREGKHFVTLAVGCTGGKHRSVAIAEQIASQLASERRLRRPGDAPGSGARMTAAAPADGSCRPRSGRSPRSWRWAAATACSPSLSALRRVTRQLTAIVTVADDGGSSGRLRRDFGVLPPGDLRMALAALCGDDAWGTTWSRVVQHRFEATRAVRPRGRQRADRRPVGAARGHRRRAWTGWAGCSVRTAGCCRWRRSRWTWWPRWRGPTRPGRTRSPWCAARSPARPPPAGSARCR